MITEYIGKNTGYLHTVVYIACTLLTLVYLPTLSLVEFLLWLVGTNLLVGYLISGFQHRYCSHKSWQPNRFVEAFSVFLTTFFLLTPCMGWASVHRLHHRYTDTEKDPHGNVHSIFDNFMVFNISPPVTSIPRWMIRDRLYGFQARWYWEIGLLSGALMFLFGYGMLWASVIAVAYVFQVTLNIVGHPERSPVNNALLSVLYSGELYHKNHHQKPSNPKFGLIDAPYQFFIRFLNVRKDR